jgi:hypothetical protein
MTTDTTATVTTDETKTEEKPSRQSRFNSVKLLEKTAKLLMKHVEHHGASVSSSTELRAVSQELREVLILREDLLDGGMVLGVETV